MKFLLCSLATLALLGTGLARAEDDPLAGRPRPIPPVAHGVGALVRDLPVKDLDGHGHALSLLRGPTGLVLAFTNATCPVCKRYGPRLARLARAYRERGIAFVFVNPSPHEGEEAMRAAREAFDLPGLYLVDEDLRIAQALGATTTAEVFVLDAARTLVYRGAVDDQYGVGFARDEPTHRYLVDALDAMLGGREPATPATTAPGCALRLPARAGSSTEVTWHTDVSRIVQRRCMHCHREGESAPFPLVTHADAKGNAAMIRYVLEKRFMPPWFASDAGLPMHDDARLTEAERSTVTTWIDAGCPEGDPAEAPLPRRFVAGWRLGTPETIVELPQDMQIPAEGTVPYRYVDVPTDFGEDKWVRAFELRPTAPQAVHHILVFARYPKDHPRYRDQPDNRQGLDGYFAAMVPGQTAYTFPAGTARFLPRGATLRFQLHYTTNGQAAVDRTRLGLHFAPTPPSAEMRTAGLANVRIRIPAGAADHREQSSRLLPVPARLYGFTPHMHVRGKAFRYEALYPDGRRQVLLDIPRYDFNWQLHYRLAEPLDVPMGTRIVATAWYDNSTANPANPDPTRVVRWGDQTWEEMLIGYVDWHPLPPGK